MDTIQKTYYYAFLLTLLINFSPLKILAYFSPFIFIGLLFLFTDEKPFIILRGIYSVIVIILLFYIYYLVYDSFVIQNYLLAFLTYSSFYILLFVDNKKLSSNKLLKQILRVCLIVFTFEAFYGLIQAIYGFHIRGYFFGDSGDFVEGTIHPQLNTEAAFSNPMFAVNMTMLLLGVLVLKKRHNKNVGISLLPGVLALLLASVIHVIIFFLIAVFVTAIVFYKKELFNLGFGKIKWRFSSFMIIGVISIAVIALIFNRKDQIADLGNQYLLNEIPRAIVTNNFLNEIVPENKEVIFIGLGPGQFSSRASLIGSGNYLGGINNPKSVPFLKSKSNYFADQYIIAQMEATADITYFGSSQQPYYSWLSVISEFGFIAFVLMVAFVLLLIKKLKTKSIVEPDKRFLSAVTSVGIIFLFLLGMQENYYEIPQAIFIGVLLLQVMYANVIYGKNEPVE